jgi:Ca2+/Na+ antiporter
VNINTGAFFEIAIFSLIANLLLWYFLANKKIGHREGIVLLAVYVLFLVTSLSNVIG